jgi:hypothetical protein
VEPVRATEPDAGRPCSFLMVHYGSFRRYRQYWMRGLCGPEPDWSAYLKFIVNGLVGISVGSSIEISTSGESGLGANKFRHAAFALSKAVRDP